MFNIRIVDIQSGTIAIVTAISYESPLSSLSEIEQELASLLGYNANGEVLFDLVCSNGIEWNRFISLQLKDGAFQINTASVIDPCKIPQKLLEEQASIFTRNPQYIRDSVLTLEEMTHIVAA